MNIKKNFLDRFTERAEAFDPNSRQAYILRLAREHGFLAAVFDAIEEGVLIVDGKQRIEYFNAGAKAMLSLPDDTANLRIAQLLPNVDWRRIYDTTAEEWTRAARQEIEVLYPKKRIVQFYLVPISRETGMAAVILHDVTERYEKELADIEGETTQAVSMLAAAVAHEIGNPLNSLYLNLQLLEQNMASPEKHLLNSEEAREMIGSCRGEVERLDQIVTQFLSAVRPGKANSTAVDLAELVRDTLQFMHQEFENRGVTVESSVPAELPKLRGDAAQLKQAFYNILKNALQATATGGRIVIRGEADDDFVSLEFSDTGKGIEFEKLNAMFKPFTSFRKGGNGIGMMIIERVCREHGAELAVDSSPGKGTTITIRFHRAARRIKVLPPAERE